jgi:hypothetical protein
VPHPLAPWQMWGGSARLTVVSGAVGPANATVSPAQLARIDYKRPETWRFWFWGKLMGGDVGAVSATTVHALFDVFVGVGRTVFDTQKAILGVPVNFNAFAQLVWRVPVGTVPGAQNFNAKWLQRVPGYSYDDTQAQPPSRDTDLIVAEHISCRVRLVMSGGDPGVSVQAEVGAFFAPNVHVRPDWFSDDEDVPQFPGGEIQGT